MYGSAAEFNTYHTSRGRIVSDDWDDDTIEAALLVASEWLDAQYEDLYSGYKADGFEQERSWPRRFAVTNTFPQYVFTNEQIPNRVKNATYEAAFRELTKPGALNVDFVPNKFNSVSVDGAVSVEYAQNLTINDVQVQIKVIDIIIQPLLDPSKAAAAGSLSGEVTRV